MKGTWIVYRCRPLVVGLTSVLILSFIVTLPDRRFVARETSAYVRMSLWTAAGPFASVQCGTGFEPWFYGFLYGLPLVAAMLAYMVRPSKTAAGITVVGFLLWLLLGYSLVRAGV